MARVVTGHYGRLRDPPSGRISCAHGTGPGTIKRDRKRYAMHLCCSLAVGAQCAPLRSGTLPFRPGAYHAPTERDQSRSKPPEPLSHRGRTMCARTKRGVRAKLGPGRSGVSGRSGVPGRSGAPDGTACPGEAAGHRILWREDPDTTIFRKIPVSPKFLLTFRPKTGYNIRRMSLERLQTHSLRLNFSC